MHAVCILTVPFSVICDFPTGNPVRGNPSAPITTTQRVRAGDLDSYAMGPLPIPPLYSI